MLRNKIQPSLTAVFDRPSSLRMRRDFVSGKLIISVRYLVQRRTTSSRPRGERHGMRVTCHPPTERVYYRRPSSLWRRRDFKKIKNKSSGDLHRGGVIKFPFQSTPPLEGRNPPGVIFDGMRMYPPDLRRVTCQSSPKRKRWMKPG